MIKLKFAYFLHFGFGVSAVLPIFIRPTDTARYRISDTPIAALRLTQGLVEFTSASCKNNDAHLNFLNSEGFSSVAEARVSNIVSRKTSQLFPTLGTCTIGNQQSSGSIILRESIREEGRK